MRGLAQEIIFALLFGAVLLVQFLYRELRRKVASMQAENEADDIRPPVVASTQVPAQAAPRFPAARMAAPAPMRVAQRALPRRARRFSRAALMPDRRAVQDAVVIAAILEPCHAQRTRDIE